MHQQHIEWYFLQLFIGCFWKQDQCNTFGNMVTLTELTNVNSIVCSTQTTSSIPHLYFQNSCYATADFSQAKCTDQGIDRVTCLQLNQPCTFVGNKCQNFVKTNQANCSDYQSVTLSVCQQIQDLACQKKDDNCDNFVQVAGMKIDSLSKLACLRYTEFAVYWNGSCQFLSTPLQCGSTTLVNALSCVKIETNRTPCIYDSVNFVCTPNFNKYSIKCTTPGLNVFGCAQVQTQACVFNNKCQEYTLTDQQCQNIKNVNSLACQIQLTDSCYYDESMLQCSPSPNQPLCSLSGLNLAACGTNSICSWNNYLTKCQCNSEIQSNECSALVVTSCTGLCSYINGQCVQSTCESQPISNCSGTLRGLKCYISNSQCFSASTCYDMYNTQCSNYGCDQAGNQCVPQGSSQVCQYLKDCNNIKCKFQQGICRPLQCSDLSQEQCYQSDDCYFSNNLCQDLLGCQQLSNDADQCNQKQCNYQKYNIMSSQLYCTAQYCDVYGASNNICNGNEMNFQACLLNGLKCQTCESITDVCLCQQAKNICLYSDNKCKSILCQGMSKPLCDSTVNRCYWSNKLNICAKKCEKIIDQSDCELRGSECYFNENTKLCYTAIITIPDVTNINDTTESFGAILATLYFLF
ncbi:hypothetical protein pb186bvf_003270 [Paramecium bursaria]